MALPAHLAERFSPALARALRSGSANGPTSERGFSMGALDAALPDAGLPRGAVVELALGEGVPGTSLVLAACHSVQQNAESLGASVPWCAFVDPTETLHAPGVVEAGVRLDRLLVARPPAAAVARTVLRLAKSAAFELVIVDLIGVRGASLRTALDSWPRLIRRLALEVDGTGRSVILLTDARAPRALPLPVAQRVEISRPALDKLVARVAKDRRGFITQPRPITWARPAPEESSEVRHASNG